MMKSFIVVLIFTTFSYLSIEALNCADNPCQLGGTHTNKEGYFCFQFGAVARCTCPAGVFVDDAPCNPCTHIANLCDTSNPLLVRCLETTDYGTSYVCLCYDGSDNLYATLSASCDPTHTLTSTTTTTTTLNPALTPSPCFNGGNFVRGSCHCPSGFGGTLCQTKIDRDSCQNIKCKNNAPCFVQNPRGPFEGICLCPNGTCGEYCELTGTLGYCSASSCLNGGACQENVITTTRHAYCKCPAGYNGIKCEHRYFTCPSNGTFIDNTMFDQGKYFECSASLQAQQRSCPKGLRYNSILRTCTL